MKKIAMIVFMAALLVVPAMAYQYPFVGWASCYVECYPVKRDCLNTAQVNVRSCYTGCSDITDDLYFPGDANLRRRECRLACHETYRVAVQACNMADNTCKQNCMLEMY